MDTHGQEQVGFDEKGFALDVPFILSNKETVADFFGDNRESWYRALLRGGSTYSKTSLDSREAYDTDLGDDRAPDLPPLDPEKITEERAKNIAAYFQVHPEAAEAFLEYAKVTE